MTCGIAKTKWPLQLQNCNGHIIQHATVLSITIAKYGAKDNLTFIAMGSNQTDIYKEHQQYWHKYIYYLLTLNGAAIVYALNKLDNKLLEPSLFILLAAIISWIFSFFFGLKLLKHSLRNIALNFTMAKIEDGVHEKAGSNMLLQNTLKVAYKNIDTKASKRLRLNMKAQFWFLLLGVIFYTGWVVYEMYLRTIEHYSKVCSMPDIHL